MPKSRAPKYDTVVLTVTDGADQRVSRPIDFEMQENDTFKHLIVLRADGKLKTNFAVESQVTAKSNLEDCGRLERGAEHRLLRE